MLQNFNFRPQILHAVSEQNAAPCAAEFDFAEETEVFSYDNQNFIFYLKQITNNFNIFHRN